MTKSELARKSGVTVQAITGYENRSYSPGQDVIPKIAGALGFPIDFFYRPDIHLLQIGEGTFRARVIPAGLRDRVLADGSLAAGVITPAIRTYAKAIPIDVPDLTGVHPEEAAGEVRKYWQLGDGPISNMVHLLETRGVMVFWMNEDKPGVDAVSYWLGDQPFVLMNSGQGTPDRHRFNLAHELGHLVLHRHEANPPGANIERQANDFASALLLPPDEWIKDAPRQIVLDDYIPLKEWWKVSIQAMIVRSYRLGCITQWQYEYAFKAINIRWGKKHEPGRVDPEESEVHKLFVQILKGKGVSLRRFASDIGLNTQHLAEFMPSTKQAAYEEQDRRDALKQSLQILRSA